jgi:hypothetical protein
LHKSKYNLSKVQAFSYFEIREGHCCVANTHALDHKTLNAHAQIRKTDLKTGLTNLDKKKNYEMCESRAEIKQDDIGVF